ncbi:MAG: PEGA domain-containing protein [Myxococcales bacterium]|nr:PEGA domain-containing protein [Myxococcales bacterium]
MSGPHPAMSGPHPAMTGPHPAMTGPHPAMSGGHPAMSGPHPAMTGGHAAVAASGSHPRATGAHHSPVYGLVNSHGPAVSGGFPRATGAHGAMSGGYGLGGQHGITGPPSGSPPPYGGPDTMPGDIRPGPGFRDEDAGRSDGRRIALLVLVALLSVGLGVAGVMLFADRTELATLRIETSPKTAEIYLDGKLLHEASTPITVSNLKPGPHELKVVAAGYEPITSTVILDPGDERTKTIELDKVAPVTLLAIKSEPSGAQVYIDGKLVDQTPLSTQEAAPGWRQLELKKEGYQPWNGRIQVQKGRENIVPSVRLFPTTVAVTFLPEPADAEAKLEVQLADGTTRALDGRKIEGLPNDGRATVVVRARGFETLERTLPKYREPTATEVLTLEKSPERPAPAAPPPRREPDRRPEPRPAPPPREETPQEDGYLKLLAKPPARASVRGKDLGWTPVLKHALPPGTYTVELVRDEEPTYRTTIQVQIKPGETTFERYTHP